MWIDMAECLKCLSGSQIESAKIQLALMFDRAERMGVVQVRRGPEGEPHLVHRMESGQWPIYTDGDRTLAIRCAAGTYRLTFGVLRPFGIRYDTLDGVINDEDRSDEPEETESTKRGEVGSGSSEDDLSSRDDAGECLSDSIGKEVSREEEGLKRELGVRRKSGSCCGAPCNDERTTGSGGKGESDSSADILIQLRMQKDRAELATLRLGDACDLLQAMIEHLPESALRSYNFVEMTRRIEAAYLKVLAMDPDKKVRIQLKIWEADGKTYYRVKFKQEQRALAEAGFVKSELSISGDEIWESSAEGAREIAEEIHNGGGPDIRNIFA